MLTRYFEQHSDAVHVLRGQRHIARQGAAQQHIQVRHSGGVLFDGQNRINAHWFPENCGTPAPAAEGRSGCDTHGCNHAQQ